MNNLNLQINPLRPINRQARLLMNHHQQAKRNRQQSLLQRASEEIGQK